MYTIHTQPRKVAYNKDGTRRGLRWLSHAQKGGEWWSVVPRIAIFFTTQEDAENKIIELVISGYVADNNEIFPAKMDVDTSNGFKLMS